MAYLHRDSEIFECECVAVRSCWRERKICSFAARTVLLQSQKTVDLKSRLTFVFFWIGVFSDCAKCRSEVRAGRTCGATDSDRPKEGKAGALGVDAVTAASFSDAKSSHPFRVGNEGPPAII